MFSPPTMQVQGMELSWRQARRSSNDLHNGVPGQPSPFIFTLWDLFIFTAHTQRL